MRRLHATLAACALAVLAASPALAGPVTLKVNPVDDDGRVTLGEVFDGAGSAAGTVVANRAGPSVVFDAGQLQALALRAGLSWDNPRNLSRVVVRQGVALPTSAIAGAASAAGVSTSTAARPGATVDVLTYARNIDAGDVIQPEDIVWTAMQAHQAPSGAPRDADQAIGLSAKRALRAGAPVASRDLASPQVIARNDMVEVAYEVGGVRLTITGRAEGNAAVGQRLAVRNLQSGRTIDAVAIGPGLALAGPAAQDARTTQQFAAR